MVMIVADLIETEVESLLLLLQRFKRAIGWSIADTVGIPPGLCTHNIQIEPNYIPSIEYQH